MITSRVTSTQHTAHINEYYLIIIHILWCKSARWTHNRYGHRAGQIEKRSINIFICVLAAVILLHTADGWMGVVGIVKQ